MQLVRNQTPESILPEARSIQSAGIEANEDSLKSSTRGVGRHKPSQASFTSPFPVRPLSLFLYICV